VPVLHGAVVDEAAYPVLFGTAQATWAPIDLRFELLTAKVDPARIARVYVVPFVGGACVVGASSMATGASGQRP
jgi:hypothetical protein